METELKNKLFRSNAYIIINNSRLFNGRDHKSYNLKDRLIQVHIYDPST